MRKLKRGIVSIPLLFFCIACTKKTPSDSNAPIDPIAKGKQIYQVNCLSCHGADPKVDGPIGPAITGSTLELLEMRVVNGKYPQGYKPKRSTSLMVALPHLQNDIKYIHEYLKQ